ncbi:hypothetical protein ACQKB4_14890 [Mycobacterium tuberculosis]
MVATIGLFIVVDMGAAVDRSWTASPPVGAGGMPCQPTVPTTTTAAVSAPSPPISRTLVNTTPPALGGPLPGVTSRLRVVTVKRELVLTRATFDAVNSAVVPADA